MMSREILGGRILVGRVLGDTEKGNWYYTTGIRKILEVQGRDILTSR